MKKSVYQSCKNIQILEFHIRFPTNEYINPSQTHRYFPIIFRKKQTFFRI